MYEHRGACHSKCRSAVREDPLSNIPLARITATTVVWALKFLTAHQQTQSRLRTALHSYFGDAAPSASTLAKAHIPYLDAAIAETLCVSTVTSGVIRVAAVDTQILGYPIPKGTDVFFLSNGPDYLMPPLAVDDGHRSRSSLEAKENLPAWKTEGIGDFDPGRWIVKEPSGEDVFDPRAGLSIPFGAGPRRCFGQKLANLSLKFHITSIVWHFEMQPLPTSQSSMRAIDGITRAPEECYIRLKAL